MRRKKENKRHAHGRELAVSSIRFETQGQAEMLRKSCCIRFSVQMACDRTKHQNENQYKDIGSSRKTHGIFKRPNKLHPDLNHER